MTKIPTYDKEKQTATLFMLLQTAEAAKTR